MHVGPLVHETIMYSTPAIETLVEISVLLSQTSNIFVVLYFPEKELFHCAESALLLHPIVLECSIMPPQYRDTP